MDKSNGYEDISTIFIKGRGQAVHGIGTSSVRDGARTLQPGSDVLDLGCGTGIPVSKILIDDGMMFYGVDASPSMVKTFHQNFPNMPIDCESVEDSLFFERKFDGIIAWGLIFLIPEEAQILLIKKASMTLKKGGKLVFTAPPKPFVWNDAMTALRSRSLGSKKYKELMAAAGLSLIGEFEDEGGNHYYNASKIEN